MKPAGWSAEGLLSACHHRKYTTRSSVVHTSHLSAIGADTLIPRIQRPVEHEACKIMSGDGINVTRLCHPRI